MKGEVIEAWDFEYEDGDLQFVAVVRRYTDRSLGASWRSCCLRCGSVSEDSCRCPNDSCGAAWGWEWGGAQGALLGRMMELQGVDPDKVVFTDHKMDMASTDGVMREEVVMSYERVTRGK